MKRPARTDFLPRIESVCGLAALAVAVGQTTGYLLVHERTGKTLLDQPTAENAFEKIVSGLIYGETAVIIFFVISALSSPVRSTATASVAAKGQLAIMFPS